MGLKVSWDRVRFLVKQFRERLWVRPLTVCLLSIGAVFVAKLSDSTSLGQYVPEITSDSIDQLLSIMASSMLVIATFSVASMVSAYAAASNTATPRAFTLVVADDASQNALSAFVGAFIFSVVALTAVKNGYFETAGLFTLFSMTALVFVMVIFTFVRWVDSIARLGRLPSTMDKVEKATADALVRRRSAPTLRASVARTPPVGQAVYATKVGYVQHIDIQALQTWAEETDAHVTVAALPGTFATPDRPLAHVSYRSGTQTAADCKGVRASFQIGTARRFDYDPRFGLVVLSEIAGRALSPGVNDPGTAIDIVGRLVRLLTLWCKPEEEYEEIRPLYDRVEVPTLSVRDMLDDAFTAIARDGAGQIEVSIRLQKALCSLASLPDEEMREAAVHHKGLALERCKIALHLPEDLATVRDASNCNAKVTPAN